MPRNRVFDSSLLRNRKAISGLVSDERNAGLELKN